MKFFIVALFFLVLFVYVTLRSFEVGPSSVHKTPLHDDSIRRFLHKINEDRDFMAGIDNFDNEYENHPKNQRSIFPLTGNNMHPLILRRLVGKRSNRQVNDEFILNNDIYGIDWINVEQTAGSKRNERLNTHRLLDNVPINGGFFG